MKTNSAYLPQGNMVAQGHLQPLYAVEFQRIQQKAPLSEIAGDQTDDIDKLADLLQKIRIASPKKRPQTQFLSQISQGDKSEKLNSQHEKVQEKKIKTQRQNLLKKQNILSQLQSQNSQKMKSQPVNTSNFHYRKDVSRTKLQLQAERDAYFQKQTNIKPEDPQYYEKMIEWCVKNPPSNDYKSISLSRQNSNGRNILDKDRLKSQGQKRNQSIQSQQSSESQNSKQLGSSNMMKSLTVLEKQKKFDHCRKMNEKPQNSIVASQNEKKCQNMVSFGQKVRDSISPNRQGNLSKNNQEEEIDQADPKTEWKIQKCYENPPQPYKKERHSLKDYINGNTREVLGNISNRSLTISKKEKTGNTHTMSQQNFELNGGEFSFCQ